MTQTAQHSWLSTAQLQHGRVRRFGDFSDHLAAEVSALETAGLVPLLGTGALRVTGADRLDFLHGQISSEVKRLGPGESRAALMLSVRGHALALMRVYRREDDLFVAVEGGAGAQVEAQLRAHIIFDQVELHDLTDTLVTFTLQGTDAAAVLRRVFGGDAGADLTDLPEPGTFAQPPFASAKVLVGPAPRGRAGGFDLHVLSRDASALVAALTGAGAALAGEDALEALRIEAGIAGAELEGGEGVLPQEAGLEHAVSYRKGCYLGQEIMARIEARGNLRRRLVGLSLTGIPEAGTKDLVQNGKTVGRLGGVAEHPRLETIALASVRTEVGTGAVLEVGGVAAVVRELPLSR